MMGLAQAPVREVVAKLLVVASILYLLCELMFNAALIDAVAAHDATSLELLGRCLAAVGASIIAVRLIRVSRWPLVAAVFVAGLVAGYILQEAVLTTAVDSVTETQRADAPDILLLESAMISRVITLDGLNKEIEKSHPAYMGFVTLLGYTSWDRSEDIEVIKAQRGRLRAQLGQSELAGNLDARYAEYQTQIANARQQYDKLMAKQADAKAKVDHVAGEYAGILNWFLQHRARCNSDGCRSRYDAQYDKRVEKALGRRVPWQSFCDKRAPRTQYYRDESGMQKRQIEGGYDCSGVDPALIANRLRLALAEEHEMLPETFEAFFASPAAKAEIAGRFPLLAGMAIKPDWDRESFQSHIFEAMADEAEEPPVLSAAELDRVTRAVLIPPIAITFSLFFSILNLAGLLKDAAVSVVKVRSTYVLGGFAVLMIAFGLFARSNGVVTGVAGFLVDWTLHYERLIYPIGSTLKGLL